MSTYNFETGYGTVQLPGDNLVRHSEDGQVCAIFPKPDKDDLLPVPWTLLDENSDIFSEQVSVKIWTELAALPLIPVDIYTPYLFLLMDGHPQPKVMNMLLVARCYLMARRVLSNSPNLPQKLLIGNINKNAGILMTQLGKKFAEIFVADEDLMSYANMLKQQCIETGIVVGAEDDAGVLLRFITLLVTQQVNYLKLCEEHIYAMLGFWKPTKQQAIYGTKSPEYFVCPALPSTQFSVTELSLNYLQQKALLCGLESLVPTEFAEEQPFNRHYFRLLLMTMLYTKEDIKGLENCFF